MLTLVFEQIYAVMLFWLTCLLSTSHVSLSVCVVLSLLHIGVLLPFAVTQLFHLSVSPSFIVCTCRSH